MTPPESTPKTVYLHGWCGHADELDAIRPALSGPVLAPGWMPAPGSIDLETWPLEDRAPGDAEAAMRAIADDLVESIRRTIVDAGFVGATLIGHSMGGALACVLAADPMLDVRRVILIDSSTPMVPERRSGLIERMTGWIDRAANSGRLATQAGWIADCSTWVPDFFHLDDQGSDRLRIERRFMFAPVVEAAAAIGGAVQWPIDESLETLSCPIRAIAGDPGRMPVDAMRAARHDAEIVELDGVGHYPHVFAADRVRELLAGWLGS